jgi:hypothetical protein
MLKRIAFVSLFALATAFAGMGVARAKTDGTNAAQTEATSDSRAPQGFCWTMMNC